MKTRRAVAIHLIPLFAAILFSGACATGSWEPAEDLAAPKPVTTATARRPAPASTAGVTSPEFARAAPRRLFTRPVLRVRPPELLARPEPSSDLEPLPLVAQDVSVVVAGHRARVVMDLVFLNGGGAAGEATLMVALPDRASPCYLGVFRQGGAGPPAGALDPAELPSLLDPEPAASRTLLSPEIDLPAAWTAGGVSLDWGEQRSSRILEPTRAAERLPAAGGEAEAALAQWAGQAAFSAPIGGVPGHSFRRVVVAYDQTLVPAEGVISFPLPALAENLRNRRLLVHDVSATFRQATVRVGRRELASRPEGQGLLWEVPVEGSEAAVYQGVLANPQVSVLAGQDPGISTTLVSMLVAPELSREASKTSTGRALFLLDTSYSSREGNLSLTGELLRNILATDDSLTEFAILCFDVRATLLTPGFVANTPEAREHYLAQVESIWLQGATSFESALELIQGEPRLRSADTFFLLGDGQITWGEEAPARLAERYPSVVKRRWICYTFGAAPHNRRLFDELTRSGGRVVHAAGGQDLLETARAHRQPAYRLDAVYSYLQDEVIVAGEPRLLYPGQVLEIAVRLRRPGTSVRMVLTIDGRNYEFSVPLPTNPLTDFLASRAWAEVFVGRLLDDPDDNTVQAIYALSRHFALANDYASFVILQTAEEVRRYGIVRRQLDFRRVQLLLQASASSGEGARPLESGMAVPAELDPAAAEVVRSLDRLGPTPIWDVPEGPAIPWDPSVLLRRPQQEVGGPPEALYRGARDLFARARELRDSPVPTKEEPGLVTAAALRVLSTAAEIGPRDQEALRLVGFTLMEWGLYDEAERLFARVRSRRPFEPQNLLLEGMAQSARGKLGEAALRYEIVLGRPFPRFEESVKPVAARLYLELLDRAIATQQGNPERALWLFRRGQLRRQAAADGEAAEAGRRQRDGRRTSDLPRGRLLLFWNRDGADLDLHVLEGPGIEVWYRSPESASGGRLFWDNTAGLGPELYEHPAMSRRGFRVYLRYYAASAGSAQAAPTAALLAAFSYGAGGRPARAVFRTVVLGRPGETNLLMSAWRRLP